MPATFLITPLVDEVRTDSVDIKHPAFLLKSAVLRSMNDALIVRVTGTKTRPNAAGGD